MHAQTRTRQCIRPRQGLPRFDVNQGCRSSLFIPLGNCHVFIGFVASSGSPRRRPIPLQGLRRKLVNVKPVRFPFAFHSNPSRKIRSDTHLENSDVLFTFAEPFGELGSAVVLVAVAVINSVGNTSGSEAENDTVPEPFVITSRNPMKLWPSPNPVLLQAVFEKNSIRYVVLGETL